MTEKIRNIELPKHSLKSENKNLAHIKDILLEAGIDEKQIKIGNHWRIERDFKKLLAEVGTGLPEGTMDYLTHTINNLTQMKNTFESKINEHQIKFTQGTPCK